LDGLNGYDFTRDFLGEAAVLQRGVWQMSSTRWVFEQNGKPELGRQLTKKLDQVLSWC
jgi:hypothetical protein